MYYNQTNKRPATPDPDGEPDFAMDAAAHVPIVAAGVIAIYGWAQFGALALPLIALQVSMTYIASRALHRILTASNYRRGVTVAAGVIAGFAVSVEGYGLHLGLERLNAANIAGGGPVFSDAVMILATVIIGVVNLFVRFAFVTGLRNLTPAEIARSQGASRAGEAISDGAERTDGLPLEERIRILAEMDRRETQAEEDASKQRGRGAVLKLTQEQAHKIFEASGSWPIGYGPTREDRREKRAS